MTFHRTAYDTTIGSSLNTTAIRRAISEAIVRDYIQDKKLNLISSLEYIPLFVTGRYTSEESIPFFAHPLIVQCKQGKFICADMRMFVRKDNGSYSEQISNAAEYDMMFHRVVLTLLALTDGPSSLRSSLGFAGVVYASWIAECCGKAFALDIGDQVKLNILAHQFYQSLFFEESKFDEEVLQMMAVQTAKALRVPVEMCLELFDRLEPATDLEGFCNNVKNILENVRLKNLVPGSLITIVQNSWFGINHRELLAVALEDPLTWIAIVVASLEQRSFKNAMVSRISERLGKQGKAQEFMKTFKALEESVKVPDEDYDRVLKLHDLN